MSLTPAMILIAARHTASVIWTPRDKKYDSPSETKNKGKITEMSRIRIQTSPSQ
jgi:hypothetical protein